jgi:6-phosphogluconolactonase
MSAQVVYVASSDSQDVTVLAADPGSGALTRVETVVVPGPDERGGSLPIAISADKRFLFAALRSEPFSVATFAIDAKSGRLSYVGSGPLDASMPYIAVDKTGRYLFAASYPANKVTVSAIAANGVVSETLQTVPTEPAAHAIIVDRGNNHVFHTSLGGDCVYQQKLDVKTGRLTPNDPPVMRTKAKAGPRHLTIAPNEQCLYLLTELDATIYVFPYDACRGTMAEATQVVSTMPKGSVAKPWGADIHLTPDGQYLYATERTTSTIAAYRVDPTSGTLTLIDHFQTEQQPRSFAIDPGGRFLYSAGEVSSTLTTHAIDQRNGTLHKVGSMPVGHKPNWVEAVTLP